MCDFHSGSSIDAINSNYKLTEKLSSSKVPYEVLNKKFRTAQKIIDREVSHVLAANSDLSNIVKKQSVKVSDVTGILDGVIEKLQVLKRKVILST